MNNEGKSKYNKKQAENSSNGEKIKALQSKFIDFFF